MIVVANTSPLIALDRIGRLHVLRLLFGRIVRPRSVLDELRAGINVYGGSRELLEDGWIETIADPAEMVLRKELGAGETAALALAVRLKADLIILDDSAARKVARMLGLNLTGTLGVLQAAQRRGILDDLEKVIQDLTAAGFHLSGAIRQVLFRE